MCCIAIINLSLDYPGTNSFSGMLMGVETYSCCFLVKENKSFTQKAAKAKHNSYFPMLELLGFKVVRDKSLEISTGYYWLQRNAQNMLIAFSVTIRHATRASQLSFTPYKFREY